MKKVIWMLFMKLFNKFDQYTIIDLYKFCTSLCWQKPSLPIKFIQNLLFWSCKFFYFCYRTWTVQCSSTGWFEKNSIFNWNIFSLQISRCLHRVDDGLVLDFEWILNEFWMNFSSSIDYIKKQQQQLNIIIYQIINGTRFLYEKFVLKKTRKCNK